MSSVLDIISRNVHLKLVQDTFGPRGRIPTLHDYQWTMQAAPEGGLILPDCIAVWLNNDTAQPYVFSALPDAPSVVLPIASDRFLFGQRRGDLLSASAHDLNVRLASCARSIFVAHPDHAIGEALRIGEARNALDEAIVPAIAYLG